jgi:hypothetical protein
MLPYRRDDPEGIYSFKTKKLVAKRPKFDQGKPACGGVWGFQRKF